MAGACEEFLLERHLMSALGHPAEPSRPGHLQETVGRATLPQAIGWLNHQTLVPRETCL